MFCASDERFVLGSKENLSENMEAFSLKVIFHWLFQLFAHYTRDRHWFIDFSVENLVWSRFFIVGNSYHVYVTLSYESLVRCAGNIRANFLLSSAYCRFVVYLNPNWWLRSAVVLLFSRKSFRFHIPCTYWFQTCWIFRQYYCWFISGIFGQMRWNRSIEYRWLKHFYIDIQWKWTVDKSSKFHSIDVTENPWNWI